jgi:hypothetical protein
MNDFNDAVDIGTSIGYTTDFTVENHDSLFLLRANNAVAAAHLAAHVTVAPHNMMLERIRAEFLEMPGLRLKPEQVQRLCGVERAPCQRVLETLVEMNFLCVKPDGAYARLTDGADHPHPHPAKADLRSDRRTTKAS